MLSEFKKFLIKGNAVDLAVGFIFGTAFATVIKSLVTNIIMPPISILTSGVDLSALKYVLKPATETTEEVAIKYGLWINDVVSFIILGFVIFMMIKFINKLHKKAEEKPKSPPAKSEEVQVLEQILETLKKD